MDENKQYVYTVKETAKLLKTNVNLIYEMINQKQLKAIRIGAYKITAKEIDRYLSECDNEVL